MYGKSTETMHFCDFYEFENGNCLIIQVPNNKVPNYSPSNSTLDLLNAHNTTIGFVNMKTGAVENVGGSNKIFAVDPSAFYSYNSGVSKRSSETGDIIYTVNNYPAGFPVTKMFKIPNVNKFLYPFPLQGSDGIRVIDGTSLQILKTLSTDFIRDNSIGVPSASEGNPLLYQLDEDFLYVRWVSRDFNTDSYDLSVAPGLCIVPIEDILSSSTPHCLFIANNTRQSSQFEKVLGAELLGIGKKSIFIEFSRYETVRIYSGRDSVQPMRYSVSLSRQHIKDLLRESSDNVKYDGENIDSLLNPSKYEEEYVFAYGSSGAKYKSIRNNTRVVSIIDSRGPYFGKAFNDYATFEEEPHGEGRGAPNESLFLNGSLTRSYLDLRISCINDYFPIYRRPISRYGKYEFAPHKVEGIRNFGGGNNFVEQTSFFMEPIPVFDRENIKFYLSDYSELTLTDVKNMGGNRNVSNSYSNPSHVTPTHLHLFDSEKYTKYKLIFE